MKAFKRIAAFMMAVMLSLGLFSEYIPVDNNPSQVEAAGYSCLAPADDGNWYLFEDGAVNWGYSGLFCDPNVGWWLVLNGRVAFEYNDLYGDPNYGWWLVTGGAVNFGYTDLFCSPQYGWWLVSGGAVAFDYNDLFGSPQYGWWLVTGGAVNFGYCDLFGSPQYGWWLVHEGSVCFWYTDLYCSPTCGWWLVNGGAVDFGYTGIWPYGGGYWFVNGGMLDWGYTGVAEYNGDWWYVENGSIKMDYTGMAKNLAGDWFLVYNGTVAWTYTGLWEYNGEWWYVTDGKWDPDFVGEIYHSDGNFYPVENGKVNLHYTGMMQNIYNDLWFYYKDGKQIFRYTGMAKYKDQWFYFSGGQIDEDYTGMAEEAGVKYYYKNGHVDNSYSGIASDWEGSWLFENGKVKKSFSGPYTAGAVKYQVTNGKAVPVYNSTPSQIQLGVFFNSREDNSDALFVSFDGVNFSYIGDMFTDSNKTSESDMTATISPTLDSTDSDTSHVNTIRDPGIMYKDGYYWTVSSVVDNGKYYPAFSYSKDLVNWSLPKPKCDSTKAWIGVNLPSDRYGTDVMATDLYADSNGDVWVTFSMGKYTDHAKTDQMACYVLKISNLQPGCTNPNTKALKKEPPTMTYGTIQKINLPQSATSWLDSSLYKEGSTYYLAIKKDGETNQIYSTTNLNNASNSGAWTLVCKDALSGYEAPFVDKFNGKYMMYTDRLIGYPHFDRYTTAGYYPYFENYVENTSQIDTTPGIFVTSSGALSGTWGDLVKVNFRDTNGSREERHGAVITITDQSAIQTILARYNAMGY